ncbi:MAG: methyltransferase domain-containing protein [Dehalococcoidales bacterium]|nr:MAG: methyltransferase domain-containing protein [Dehalococcoidales bacterium]
MGKIKDKYDSLSPVYDFLDLVPEALFYRRWRRCLWEERFAGKILEIGIGTGKNTPYYPSGSDITGIDISTRMLEKASKRIRKRSDIVFSMLTMDAASLAFADNTFDVIAGSFIFTVLENNSDTLEEIKRVGKSGGILVLLEFVRSSSRFSAMFQDFLVHFTSPVYGAIINRDLLSLIGNAGFQNITATGVGDGIVMIIRANIP